MKKYIGFVFFLLYVTIFLGVSIYDQFAKQELTYKDNDQIKTIQVYKKHLQTTESIVSKVAGKEYETTIRCTYGFCLGGIDGELHACNGHQKIRAHVIKETYIENYAIKANDTTTILKSPKMIREYEEIIKNLESCH